MADTQHPIADAGANTNSAAEKDVQDVLAELKAEEVKNADGEASAPAEQGTNEKPSDGAQGDTNAADDEEAKIIAAANKLGQESASDEKTKQRDQRGSRAGQNGEKKRVNYRENIKSDVTTLEETNDPEQIRKQVEFYFSDSNLPMDKFLLSKVGGSENRPVELSLLHSFKRMRRFQPFSAIVEALRTSELVELTNDDTCVRRKVPLPETVTESADSTIVRTFEDKAMNRSIYAKGFGEEEPSTQFDIEAFFAPYGPTNAVRLRRTNEKIFKGSVFVEFDSEETQQKFLALDPKPKWKGTADLLIKSKKDYCEEKVKEIEAGRLKPSRGRGNFRGRGRGDNRRGGDQKRGFNKGRGGQRGRGRGNRNQEGGRRENMKDSRGVPIVQSSEDKSATRQKRSREDEPSANGNGAAPSNGDSGDRPAKKVDTKEA